MILPSQAHKGVYAATAPVRPIRIRHGIPFGICRLLTWTWSKVARLHITRLGWRLDVVHRWPCMGILRCRWLPPPGEHSWQHRIPLREELIIFSFIHRTMQMSHIFSWLLFSFRHFECSHFVACTEAHYLVYSWQKINLCQGSLLHCHITQCSAAGSHRQQPSNTVCR